MINQITEQLTMKELNNPKSRKYLRRLTAQQAYTLATWVKENAETLKEIHPPLNRVQVAERAAKELGFPVGSSAIETAEKAVGVRVIPEPNRPYIRSCDVVELQKEVMALQKRLEVVEKIVKEFV
jgi:hypothetical protein